MISFGFKCGHKTSHEPLSGGTGRGAAKTGGSARDWAGLPVPPAAARRQAAALPGPRPERSEGPGGTRGAAGGLLLLLHDRTTRPCLMCTAPLSPAAQLLSAEK